MWVYNDKEFREEDIPENAVGFVYEMRSVYQGHIVRYIGKKNFFADVKTKLSKKDLPTDKRMKTYTRKRKFTYQNYYSSNDVLKQLRKDGVEIQRTILHICYSKTELSYMECKYQFIHEVLEREEYLNGNILGKFYKLSNGKKG